MHIDDKASHIRRVLQGTKSIAVVGLSPSSHRPSYVTAAYMLEHGYRIFPVNPHCEEVLGLPCYAALSDIPEPIDMVDCFRRVEEIPALAQQAIDLGVRAFWVQLGLSSPMAQQLVCNAGIDYVEDRCVKIEHARLLAGWAAPTE